MPELIQLCIRALEINQYYGASYHNPHRKCYSRIYRLISDHQYCFVKPNLELVGFKLVLTFSDL